MRRRDARRCWSRRRPSSGASIRRSARRSNHEVPAREGGEGIGRDSKLGYGELAEAAMASAGARRVEHAHRSRTRAEFRYIGKGEVQIDDLHDITTGKAVYGADVQPARA